ncbi:aminoglycoside adenylyltransferase domain-containing protein [Paenibacillus tengchongensis]|uniref:aminoglycoside adenylyltransferase domain-containing protein n=1 Tax=Paenibacillus tengchongensis TaxID=2608684 RepID=UPI00124D2B07|nr:aminoglycoside adenylyltransferase domain-containing protein [Paenibacillus tengchongensis]
MDTQPILDDAVKLFQEELAGNLAGVYLHGSLAMNSFHPEQSDIDLLIVVNRPPGPELLKTLARRIVDLHESIPMPRGIELSIVLARYLQEFEHPTPFEFHFSEAHLLRYKEDENYLCGGFADADLAAHFTVVYLRGIALYGPQPREAIAPVDKRHFIQSILWDIENADKEIVKQPVYYTLNLCRALAYLSEEKVLSKREGGEWGLQALPEKHSGIIQHALNAYTGKPVSGTVNDGQFTSFAQDLLSDIHKKAQHHMPVS